MRTESPQAKRQSTKRRTQRTFGTAPALDAEALAFAAAKAYNVIVPLEFKKLADINDKIKVTNAITKAGVDKKHAKDFYAGKSQTIAEGIDIEQAEKMQEELRKSGIEMQVIPQKE